LSLLIVTVSNI